MPRTVAIIQARLSSTRFPRKILADIGGKPMLQRVYERACRIAGVDHVTITIPDDEPELNCWVRDTLRICPMTGSPTDVLRRYYVAALATDATTIMRLTGDDPLLDPALAADVLRAYHDGPAQKTYAHNLGPATDGFDVEVFSRSLLERAHQGARLPEDREHATPWMRRGGVGIFVRQVVVDGPAVKLSVDTPDDLERVRAIWREGITHAEACAAYQRLEVNYLEGVITT